MVPIKLKILIVDDDPKFVDDLTFLLQDDFSCTGIHSGEEALTLMAKRNFDAIFLDIGLGSGMDGFEVMEQMRKQNVWIPVIIVSGHKDIDEVVKAMKLGASNFIGKQPNTEELKAILLKAIEDLRLRRNHQRLREEIHELKGDLVGESPTMKEIRRTIDKISRVDTTVLILGQTGTGKELVARDIHRKSQRSDEPFIAVNCAAIPDNLFESELFGHEKGAFTGATQRHIGKFEQADNGSIFLDEVSELDMRAQAKLLRVLQEKTVERLGGTDSRPIDVRVIAATNRDLRESVEKRAFRDDLYYRLNVATIHILPLRERKEDISPLIKHFLSKKSIELKKTVTGLSEEAENLLLSYSWPGNVRELENVIEHAIVHADQEILDISLFSSRIPPDYTSYSTYEEAKDKALEQFQRDYVSAILRTEEGNITRAAARMGLTRQGLQKMLKKLFPQST